MTLRQAGELTVALVGAVVGLAFVAYGVWGLARLLWLVMTRVIPGLVSEVSQILG